MAIDAAYTVGGGLGDGYGVSVALGGMAAGAKGQRIDTKGGLKRRLGE